MASGGNVISYSEQQLASQSSYERPRHAAEVEIEVSKSNVAYITHMDKNGVKTTPKITSYKDGVHVGCSFISNEALNKIYLLHRDFIASLDSKKHQ